MQGKRTIIVSRVIWSKITKTIPWCGSAQPHRLGQIEYCFIETIGHRTRTSTLATEDRPTITPFLIVVLMLVEIIFQILASRHNGLWSGLGNFSGQKANLSVQDHNLFLPNLSTCPRSRME